MRFVPTAVRNIKGPSDASALALNHEYLGHIFHPLIRNVHASDDHVVFDCCVGTKL